MNWHWSFHLSRLFDVDIRIHWSLPVFFLFYLIRAAQFSSSPMFIGLFVVLPFVLLFASIVAHEFGHVFAARHYNIHVGRIILTPIGGMGDGGRIHLPRQEFVIAFGGPLVTLILAIISYTLYFALGGSGSWTMLVPFTSDELFRNLWLDNKIALLLIYDFAETQLFLFWFNVLMIAYPMDGGRMLLAFLWRKKGFYPALLASCKVSRVLAIVMGLIGIIFLQFLLIAIAFFIFLQAHMVLSQSSQLGGGDFYGGGGYQAGHYYDSRVGGGRDDDWRKAPPQVKPDEVDDPSFQKKLDDILTKVHEEGMHKLTWREKRFLKKASKRYKDRDK